MSTFKRESRLTRTSHIFSLNYKRTRPCQPISVFQPAFTPPSSLKKYHSSSELSSTAFKQKPIKAGLTCDLLDKLRPSAENLKKIFQLPRERTPSSLMNKGNRSKSFKSVLTKACLMRAEKSRKVQTQTAYKIPESILISHTQPKSVNSFQDIITCHTSTSFVKHTRNHKAYYRKKVRVNRTIELKKEPALEPWQVEDEMHSILQSTIYK